MGTRSFCPFGVLMRRCQFEQAQRVDDLRSAVQRERAALEQLEGMISSERKLLSSCNSRYAVSPVLSQQVREEESELELLWERERESLLTYTRTPLPGPRGNEVSDLFHISEEDRKQRAVEKRAAFLAAVPRPAPLQSTIAPAVVWQVTEAQHPEHATDSARGDELINSRHMYAHPSILQVSEARLQCDRLTAGSAPIGVNVPAVARGSMSEIERKLRAQAKRAAFMGSGGGVQGQGYGGATSAASLLPSAVHIPGLKMSSPSALFHSFTLPQSPLIGRNPPPRVLPDIAAASSRPCLAISDRHTWVGLQNIKIDIPSWVSLNPRVGVINFEIHRCESGCQLGVGNKNSLLTTGAQSV